MSLRIRTWGVCALALVLSLGIGLSAQANPLGGLSVVINAGGANPIPPGPPSVAPISFDGVPNVAAPDMLVNDRIVQALDFATDPGAAYSAAIATAFGANLSMATHWVEISWHPPTIEDGTFGPIIGTIQSQNAATTFVIQNITDTPLSYAIARSVLVSFYIDGFPVTLGGGLLAAPPFFSPSPATDRLFAGAPTPPGNFSGALCGTTWAICLFSHGISTATLPALVIDEVRLSFFMHETPEPASVLLLGSGLLLLGAMRRRATA